ncbi:triple gene block protein 1 [Pseudostellaria heterophylla carlavirus 2]|uniref:Triple gene block protein 1 n=1 Tax=Pseudostellaria heterophylla carlavirus 2 TaxID=2982811 RepID=A0A977TNI9_9VIRU|nr:triple gene block protein 1 [Pseudostellaria heterophylla carlavirus 2]
MDVLIKRLLDSGFERHVVESRGYLIVSCVPGAGKSTFIRDLIASDSRFVACTFGKPDKISNAGNRILDVRAVEDYNGAYLICDEFQEGDWKALKACCFFGDLEQSFLDQGNIKPNFTLTKTLRFGSSTCTLLQSFGFKITSEKQDEVLINSPENAIIHPNIIAIGTQAEKLLCYYRLEFKRPGEVRGCTFDKVTLLTDYNTITEELRSEFYVALTRHRACLEIVCPDATFAPA